MKYAAMILIGVAVYVFSYHYNRRFLDWLRFQSIGTRDYVYERLSLMFYEVQPQQVLIGLFILSFGLGSLVFLLFIPYWFPAIVFSIAITIGGWKAPKPIVDLMYRRRVTKFNDQMVDGLSLMSNGMKSGLSIVQAMGLVTEEMPDPIRQEINLILNQNKLGVPIEEAFTNLSKRIRSDDVEMFVTAVNILRETGGNLAETFDVIVGTIRERIRVEKRINAMTAQGLIQGAFVMAVPPLLGVMFYQSDPEFMRPLFTTTPGWIIIMTVLLLQLVAFFVIMRIIKIEV